VDNLLSSQVDRDLSKELEHKGVHITTFIANSRSRHQKDSDAKAEALKNMESSSLVAHASAEDHTWSNERKRKELQDLRGGNHRRTQGGMESHESEGGAGQESQDS
jgi:hypothetical protein